ncbi:MAG: hypothetical protein A3C30_03655 [Candidatus Levybacteria bacterium RIFCSPHIGHO2_02_FULL_40_18]|nr:MAG: hypothetical protein A2869_00230 [Candidatus Levybacteria bacterium RIFCSPHIGHO2_01_FULL_40_58]OGH26181.1 MAG: hypothetical protein A3C30_03655 [Candidatus Levybacteria bacterium RIFCSPHIGHO2_02_FULL_40_18]OGH31365.1 MAG: hypothetical protein A3E43_03265 [Candidatus Levybacteria bacterium RIFCSPHIGHO2_12_FULL_40_31]OGH40064.1 MAG: hypothetical protein A2894_03970 [Candidatus Levybacteria bacterium RIFCSPLOWO2_01_FULL_40_64]OGH49028.1 MAG: hypothetical protein A3I54_00435 [Candidatus Lev
MIEEIKGLASQEAAALLNTHGKNSVEQPDKNETLLLLASQYKNIISLILALATVFSLLIGDFLDAFFIFLVLVINGFFGFVQEYRAQRTLEKLKALTAPSARVIRDGQEIEIDAKEIVPADIIVLREGDRVPADGKLITGVSIEIDEAILTGESMPVEKKDHDEIYSGTFIVRGRGYIEVVATGFETRLGQIAAQLSETEKPQVPLARNLSNLGKRLAFIAIALAFALVPIGVIQGRDFNEIVLIATSTAVAMIPEGLALVVTVALAVGAYRMVKRKVIVRKMAAIETLGATNVILSDKTGTLTQNKMAVKKHWVSNKEHLNLLLRSAVLGNTANLVLEEDGGRYEVVGDATDGAILSFIKQHVNDLDSFRTEGKVIEEKPFNPDTKIIEVIWEKEGERHIFIRGAPETIFKLDGIALEAHHAVDAFTNEGLRVIAFAHKKAEDKRFAFLGIVGIYDPPREEAKNAISEAAQAGIRIVMVTGDNPTTAKKIAEEIGLISEGELVLTHKEIENISDEELLKLIPKTRVFSRMVPNDKLRLVRLYQKMGAIVAVTGDGVNDAPALSEANIGVAMGETGTDVAKEASDMVITDDNLLTIVKAIEEGRAIFDNIVKTVVFLLSTNLSEFFVIFFSVILGFPIPFTPTQILWINLVSDGAPAMALATDIKRRGLLKRKPRDISEQILNFARLRFILLITFVFSLILIAVYAAYLNGSPIVPRLLVFNLLVIGEMIIIFIIRGGIFPINRFMIASIIITLLLQYFVSTQPFLRALFRI